MCERLRKLECQDFILFHNIHTRFKCFAAPSHVGLHFYTLNYVIFDNLWYVMFLTIFVCDVFAFLVGNVRNEVLD